MYVVDDDSCFFSLKEAPSCYYLFILKKLVHIFEILGMRDYKFCSILYRVIKFSGVISIITLFFISENELRKNNAVMLRGQNLHYLIKH